MGRSGSDPIQALSGHFLEVLAKTTNKSIADRVDDRYYISSYTESVRAKRLTLKFRLTALHCNQQRGYLLSAAVLTQLVGTSGPRGLRLRSAAARLLGLRVRIPLGKCLSICCDWRKTI